MNKTKTNTNNYFSQIKLAKYELIEDIVVFQKNLDQSLEYNIYLYQLYSNEELRRMRDNLIAIGGND